jgi:hypothetical protein
VTVSLASLQSGSRASADEWGELQQRLQDGWRLVLNGGFSIDGGGATVAAPGTTTAAAAAAAARALTDVELRQLRAWAAAWSRAEDPTALWDGGRMRCSWVERMGLSLLRPSLRNGREHSQFWIGWPQEEAGVLTTPLLATADHGTSTEVELDFIQAV